MLADMTLTRLRINRPGLLDRGVTLTPFTHGDKTPAAREAQADDDSATAAVAAVLDHGERVVVAIGVSGGKDSCAAAIATVEHLRATKFRGVIVLIHADLGRVEWSDSLPTCERLAAFLGVELIVVRREQGDMMDRWLQRWRDNLHRYVNLLCVKVILPWSTPEMRFCTSELKVAVICRALVQRYPGHTIVSVAGIRRDESTGRRKAPTAKVKAKLASKTLRTTGYDWSAIAHWSEADVFAFCAARGFAMHEGYTKYQMTRVSCIWCIMQSEADRRASATNPEHHPLLREMVGLEVVSTFGFWGDSWLADLRPDLLDQATLDGVREAKLRAARREAAEARIPDHLLYEEGWPRVMPTETEAELLAETRREVAAIYGIEVKYTDAASLLARYAELMAEKAQRDARAAKRNRGRAS